MDGWPYNQSIHGIVTSSCTIDYLSRFEQNPENKHGPPHLHTSTSDISPKYQLTSPNRPSIYPEAIPSAFYQFQFRLQFELQFQLSSPLLLRKSKRSIALQCPRLNMVGSPRFLTITPSNEPPPPRFHPHMSRLTTQSTFHIGPQIPRRRMRRGNIRRERSEIAQHGQRNGD